METRVVQLLRTHGFPEPQRQFVVRADGRFVGRVDLAFPQWRVAIEYESFEWHLGATALLRDSQRRNALIGSRWTVLTATAEDVRTGGRELCTVLHAVARNFGVAEQA